MLPERTEAEDANLAALCVHFVDFGEPRNKVDAPGPTTSVLRMQEQREALRKLSAEITLGDTLACFVTDAFTSKPYAGNPAAVVLLPRLVAPTPASKNFALDDNACRTLARQMNLSETAFVTPVAIGADFPGASDFDLRWFTPDGTEVNLCGHATLATAATLVKEAGNTSPLLTFHTLSGPLTVAYDSAAGKFEMVLPANPPVDVLVGQGAHACESVASALAVVVAGQAVPVDQCILAYNSTSKKLLIRLPDGLESLTFLKSGLPSDLPARLHAAHPDGSLVKGVIVTTAGNVDGSEYHFQSRYFAPWVAIPEDPVTGSAHTVLCPYWSQFLDQVGAPLRARQCSPRGGDLVVTWDTATQRVSVLGDAAVVMRGTIATPV